MSKIKQNYVKYVFYGYKSSKIEDTDVVLIHSTKHSVYVSNDQKYIDTKQFIKMQCYLNLFHSELYFEYEVLSLSGEVLESNDLSKCFNPDYEDLSEPSPLVDLGHLSVGMA